MIHFLPRLYVIADPSACIVPDDRVSFLETLEETLAGGARLVQFRAKHLSPAQQWEFGKEVSAMCSAYAAHLIVNDRADLALALDADGVHLPANGLPVAVARRLMEWRKVGVSCHSVADVITAEEEGAHFVTLSPIFSSTSKPGYGPALDLHNLKTAANLVKIPIFALGGISPETTASCRSVGAYGVASMSGILRADDPAAAVQAYHTALR